MEAMQEPPIKPKEPNPAPAPAPGSERWGFPRPLFNRPAIAVLSVAAVACAGAVALVLGRKAGSSRDAE